MELVGVAVTLVVNWVVLLGVVLKYKPKIIVGIVIKENSNNYIYWFWIF